MLPQSYWISGQPKKGNALAVGTSAWCGLPDLPQANCGSVQWLVLMVATCATPGQSSGSLGWCDVGHKQCVGQPSIWQSGGEGSSMQGMCLMPQGHSLMQLFRGAAPRAVL